MKLYQTSYEGSRPTISAYIYIPELESGHRVNFLLDTGADNTSLSPMDAIQLGISEDMSVEKKTVRGIEGDDVPCFSIKSTILSILSEHSKDLEKSCTHVEILEQIDVVPTLKRSIMGRDILDRYNVELSGTEKEITLTRNKFGDGTYMLI